MSSNGFQSFHSIIAKHFDEKNYSRIIDNILKLLAFECDASNMELYQQLCVYSLIALRENKTADAETFAHTINICNKYETVIAYTNDPSKVLDYFICLEYVCELVDSSNAVLMSSRLIENVAAEVLNRIRHWNHAWTDADFSKLNRFIVVLVELESKWSNDRTPKFTVAAATIKFFSRLMTDERKTAYPSYLLNTLNILRSYSERIENSLDEIIQIGKLAEYKHGKDIAIMMSQLLRSGTLLITRGSLEFKQKIAILVNNLYEVMRNKNLSASAFIFQKTYDEVCCNSPTFHPGVQLSETLRTIVVDAINRNDFNEVLLSVMWNFALTEASTLFERECKERESLQRNLYQTFRSVQNNIEKIVTTCGLDRAKRTLLKLLSVDSLEVSECVHIINGLLKICTDVDNYDEKIDWLAMKLMFCNNHRSQVSCLYQIHTFQSKMDPEKFELIATIVERLPKKAYPAQLSSIDLELLQVTVEIDYPQLPVTCLRKLVDDVKFMAFYRNDNSHNANVCRTGIRYLQSSLQTSRILDHWTILRNSRPDENLSDYVFNDTLDELNANEEHGKVVLLPKEQLKPTTNADCNPSQLSETTMGRDRRSHSMRRGK